MLGSIVWLLLAGTGLRAGPEFVGVLTMPGTELFVLADPERGQAPRWVRRGEGIGDYVVVDYFPATETLSLQKAGEVLRLRLRPPRSEPAGPQQAMLRRAGQEVAKNEGWPEPIRFQGPHLFKGNWIVVAHHEIKGRTETRVVVFTAAGLVREYLRP